MLLLAQAASGQRPFVRVLDLEQRAARPGYLGWAWEVEQGTAVIGGMALWLADPGEPPIPLLEDVGSDQVHDLGDGHLAVHGTSKDGRVGLWVTDGGQPRLLSRQLLTYPARPGSRIARRGDVILAKGWFMDPPTDSLVRLSDTEPPRAVGPSGVIQTSGDDPTMIAGCAAVFAAPKGFVDCGRTADWQTLLRFTDDDGNTAGFDPAWPYAIDEAGPVMGDYRNGST